MPASKMDASPAAADVDARPIQDDSEPRLSFAPLIGLENTFRFWWFVFALMIIGGMVGWLIHRSRPPVYEAVAQVSATIDYVGTGPMTQFEEDIALNNVGDILYSNLVVQRVVDQAAAQGIKTNISELKDTATLERRVNSWVIRVRDTSPKEAELLANFWIDEGQAQLQESSQHAKRSQQLDKSMLVLEQCLAQSVEVEPTSGQCGNFRFSEIQSDLATTGAAYTQEIQGSLGLSPAIILGPFNRATTPTHPVLLSLGQLVLAGAMLGLLAGVWLVQLGIPARWIAS